MYRLKFILVPNFSSLGWFSFLSTVISCHQLLTAANSWWQLIWKKADWNFHVDTKVDKYAKIQLSRLIFAFTNFYQLVTAIDSFQQMMIDDIRKKADWNFPVDTKVYFCFNLLLSTVDSWYKKNYWNFHVHTKVNMCAKFRLFRLIFIFISCQQLLSAVDSS